MVIKAPAGASPSFNCSLLSSSFCTEPGLPMYMPGAMAQAERATEVTAKSKGVFIRIGQFFRLMGYMANLDIWVLL